jgi:hypothetical protein
VGEPRFGLDLGPGLFFCGRSGALSACCRFGGAVGADRVAGEVARTSTLSLRSLLATYRFWSVVLRPFSVPERLGGFGVLVAVGAIVWPAFTDRTGLGLPCPLRTLTGVPCPFCGLTTGAVALVRGEAGAAFAANPMIFGLAVLALAVGPLVALRAVGVIGPPVPWSSARRRKTEWLAGLTVLASWLFQLHRLGLG